jgi:hypothetical protein
MQCPQILQLKPLSIPLSLLDERSLSQLQSYSLISFLAVFSLAMISWLLLALASLTQYIRIVHFWQSLD